MLNMFFGKRRNRDDLDEEMREPVEGELGFNRHSRGEKSENDSSLAINNF
jgi:hypothetical protein